LKICGWGGKGGGRVERSHIFVATFGRKVTGAKKGNWRGERGGEKTDSNHLVPSRNGQTQGRIGGGLCLSVGGEKKGAFVVEKRMSPLASRQRGEGGGKPSAEGEEKVGNLLKSKGKKKEGHRSNEPKPVHGKRGEKRSSSILGGRKGGC